MSSIKKYVAEFIGYIISQCLGALAGAGVLAAVVYKFLEGKDAE